MKKILLISLFFTVYSTGNAQWKTIYEAGVGTSVSLHDDCDGVRFSFAPGGNFSFLYSGTNQNQLLMHAYMEPFTNQSEMTAGFYKYLPEMAQYASLRVYLDTHVTDSVIGTVHYSKMLDSTFIDPNTGAPIWNGFASNISSTLIYFSNFEADNTIYIYTDFDTSPGHVYYEYLRIEADTTQVLSTTAYVQPDFDVYSTGKELRIQPSLSDANYEVEVFDLSGKCVCREQKSGSQSLPLDYSKGIYLVSITQNDLKYQKKIYVE